MLKLRGGIAAIAFICLSGSGHAAEDPLAVGRQMLAEDNPGDLWVLRGEKLFHEKRGPKQVSLEKCDFGLGPGKLEGAFAQLPRYFADTDKVQDLESRLLTCMVGLQGFKREDIVKNRFGNLDRMSDMEALVSFIGSKSNGMKMNVPLSHQKEKEMFKAGEYIFYRRNGPLDFACATCHTEDGKRIRLQDLPNMTDPRQMQAVVATAWPAYRGTQSTVRTMQHRLYDCNWQMRLPDLGYVSDMSIALTTYLNYSGNGGVIQLPGVRR
ncbi:MAG TPA: sulfur oxidation c-type cytochrome SoxA [Burkholderiales bacterium]|nr:sulfur oxidation c-type cytochrome SoxA [Burkholderiales bacterium]